MYKKPILFKWIDGHKLEDLVDDPDKRRIIKSQLNMVDWENQPKHIAVHIPFSGCIDGQFFKKYFYNNYGRPVLGLTLRGTIG